MAGFDDCRELSLGVDASSTGQGIKHACEVQKPGQNMGLS
jgi:hypothetical protein